MNKEILFKGKQKNSEVWVESYSIIQADALTYLKHPSKSGQWIEVCSITAIRFSGILDKSGKKLFEGDKVKVWNSQTTPKPILVVTFEDGSFCLRVPGTDDFESAVTFRDALDQAMKANTLPVYEKVGSIFDNSENENS